MRRAEYLFQAAEHADRVAREVFVEDPSAGELQTSIAELARIVANVARFTAGSIELPPEPAGTEASYE